MYNAIYDHYYCVVCVTDRTVCMTVCVLCYNLTAMSE